MFYNTDQHKNPAQLDTLRALIELYLGPYCPEFCPGIVEHSDQVDPKHKQTNNKQIVFFFNEQSCITVTIKSHRNLSPSGTPYI